MSTDFDFLARRLRSVVETLAVEPRVSGSRAHAAAREYISDGLSQAGFSVRLDTYNGAGFRADNIIADAPVRDPELPLLIIAAHYDTKPDSPGADDNASAVAALLELARWIRPQLDGSDLRANLQLVSYDLEEWGLLGSELHARRLQREKTDLRGMMSLEMLGYTDHEPGSQQLPPQIADRYPDVGNFIGVCGNERSASLLQVVSQTMIQTPDLPVEYIAVPGNGEILAETRLSDHSPFWDHGYQALMITDTSFYRNPHYHRSTDTPETLDYPFLARVTVGVCESVRQLLTSPSLP